MSRISLLVTIPVALAGLAVSVLAVALLVHSQTIAGRLVGVSLLAAAAGAVSLASWFGARRRRRRVRLQAGFLHLAVATVLIAIGTAVSPDGRPAEGASLVAVREPTKPFRRMSLVNLVPEIDQVVLGLAVLPYFNANITEEKAERLGIALSRHYNAMQSHPEFVRVGSSLGLTYEAILGREAGAFGHLYAYTPAATEDAGPRPVLLWLHGRGGNLKASLWTLKPLADQFGFVVVAPTCGNGNWTGSAGARALQQALDHCRSRPDLDLGRVFVAGFDLGCQAIPFIVASEEWKVDRIAMFSPMDGTALLRTEGFADSIQGIPTLVMHGMEDLESPSAELEAAVKSLRQTNSRITQRFLPDEDHYFVWTRANELATFLVAWVGSGT